MLTTSQTPKEMSSASSSELVSLGSRIVSFGEALQQGTTTVGELQQLAKACGIVFKLRTVGESESAQHG